MTRKYVRDIGAAMHSVGVCASCRRERDLVYELCKPCRQPEDRRDLVEVGVPCGSANSLIWMIGKAKAQGARGKDIETILAVAHPKLMQNIKVDADGALRLESDQYIWVRRYGWTSATWIAGNKKG